MSKKFERHESRLATTDEKGHRVFLYPEEVKGFWRERRTIFYWFLIAIYLVLPWIHIQGKQSILLDIAGREFVFFGHVFYAHNAPLLIFLFLGGALFIAYVTSIWGRVWCGWACPQTVFIDAVFLKIERLVEGKPRQREALTKAPWNKEKIFKKGLKWFLFTIAAMHIAHSFMGYFVGARELFWITLSPPSENMTLFLFTMGLTALLLFDFGWFREQVCIVACPYGRFQSVLMDENSYVVAYDQKRGEPRRAPDISKQNEGDCINCYHCVKACPTGIDIRRGTQLECIACTNCIDACDDIMRKVGKPEGLIRYATENQLKGIKKPSFSPRSMIYLALIVAVFTSFFYTLSTRPELDIVILHTGSSPYQTQERSWGIEVTNQRQVNISSPSEDNPMVRLTLKPEHPLSESVRLVAPRNPINIEKGLNRMPFFLRYSDEILSDGRAQVEILLINEQTQDVIKQMEVNLVGPRH